MSQGSVVSLSVCTRNAVTLATGSLKDVTPRTVDVTQWRRSVVFKLWSANQGARQIESAHKRALSIIFGHTWLVVTTISCVLINNG